MKILVTSDLHINDWIPFSTLDKSGRPSRLLDYLKLAHKISELAKEQECDGIIIAGDISECSIQRPMVHDVIGDFLRICSRHTEVHLIHGQHDCDSKQAEAMGMNSILKEICKDLNNENQDRKRVHYYDSPTLTEINGKSVFFQSWTQNHELSDQKADIFVGHGIVTGCTNLDGYVFMNGFNKEDLFDRYKLSIIGDIHKKQYHHNESKDRLIIQPGSPIQNTWKDHEDCGIHVIHFNEEIDIEFFPIHELVPDTFHRFTYDYQGELTDLIHTRPKIKSKNKEETKKSIELTRDNSFIFETCLKILKEETNTGIDKALTVQFLEELFSTTKLNSNKVISNTVINSIEAENFLSIDKLSLNFNEFPHSCVISGFNGSGKSTVPEAIYWCLTGSTTKTINISDILNNYKNSESCSVKVNLTINNQELTIVRERNNKSSSLYFIDKDQNVIKRGSIRETQEEIYNLLGLKEWQIFMFSYFSAEKTSIFAGLGDSAKNDLISQIVGLDFIESMREICKEKRSEIQTASTKLEGIKSECESTINSLKSKLSKLNSETINNKPEIEFKISKKNIELVTISEELEKIKSELVGISDTSDFSELTKQYYALQSKYENEENKRVLIETKLADLKKELKTCLSGVCPTCNQGFHNEDYIASLKTKISENFTNLKSLADISVLKSELTELHDDLINKEEVIKKTKILNNKEKDFQSKVNSLKLEISELTNELLKESIDVKLIEDVENEIQIKNKQFEDIIKNNSGILNELNCYKYLETSLFKKTGDLVRELNKQGSKFIQSCIDELTNNTGIQIKINNELKLYGEFHNKMEVSYDLMSSGQKRLTDIILMVSMNNLFSKIYNLKDGVLGLSVYDEILSFLDDKYIEISKQIVDQSISKKILIITHDNNLINMYDSRIIVSMSKNGSIYNKSWV